MHDHTISVDQIIPAPYNPRIDLKPRDIEYVKAVHGDVRLYGPAHLERAKQPIVVRENGEIVDSFQWVVCWFYSKKGRKSTE